MRDSTLRWGLGMGLVGAALGIAALLLGAFFFPIALYSSGDAVVAAILVRGVLALIGLGVTLSLCYYAGLRVEQDRVRAAFPSPKTDTTTVQERSGSLIAGLVVAFCWWFGTTLTGYLLPLLPQAATSAANSNDFGERLIWGILFTLIGTGLGGLGSRTVTGRRLLDRVMASPTATTVPLASTYLAPTAPGESAQPGPISGAVGAGELPEEPESDPANNLSAESLQ